MASTRKIVVKGPSQNELMFNQYGRSEAEDNPTKALVFTLEGGSVLGVIPQIYQHVHRRDNSVDWLIIGQVATGGIVLVQYSTQTRRGWYKDFGGRILPMLTEIDPEAMTVPFEEAARLLGVSLPQLAVLSSSNEVEVYQTPSGARIRRASIEAYTGKRELAGRQPHGGATHNFFS